ncbi:dihydroneopterin aldolase [Levilinea saccharolytica]|uniref:7,8-dihydroneopterin aldolase n=1 Tax=Levilinea saccharolytica TaxID=229921 RepID=A0A0P6XRF7_9CHLR|nr:dihydroneopterin aldolase [Levilinea saccharolytica]KPL85116.1 hypothetical protein ADN01_07035 [Levilinea saccharolytica]GAP18232.1 dihydroneopterin aldolase [Levilinea saccharolytica]
MDKVLVKDLLVRGVIGVSDRERAEPQDILINIILYMDTSVAGATDRIEDSVSYSVVARKVFALVETAHRYTVEALAEDIARLCLLENKVQRVMVRVEKPDAVRFARSVGVEIERGRE